MSEHIAKDLKKINLFAELPDELLLHLASEVQECTLAAGEILFNKGDVGDALFFIRSGEIEIFEPEDDHIFETLLAGDYFGEMALLEAQPRTASARMRTETSLLRLERVPFMAILEKNPHLAVKMTTAISGRLRHSMAAPTASSAPSEKGSVVKQEQQTKVFISYSRRDKEFVHKLHEAISAKGIDTWVDWENIPLTADWWNEIRLGIENADAFAFVISPDSLTSEVCGREVQTAVDAHKRLIPILHRDPQKGNPMHEKISSHNWIYMRDDAELTANVPEMLQVINTDLDFVKAHTRLLERALGWERANKNNSFVLQGDELHSAERWLENAGKKQPQPTSLHIEFIHASRRAATQRQRTIMMASLVGLVIAVALAIVSFVFYLQANEAKNNAEIAKVTAQAAEAEAVTQRDFASTSQVEAENQRNEAVNAQATAVVAKNEAITQANIAATKQTEAEAAQAEAEAQKTRAEAQARLAKAGDLAASGLTLLEANPPLAILLALESDRLFPDNKTAQEVLSLIPIYFPPLKDSFINPYDSVSQLAWSPAGQLVSTSGNNIVLWNLDTHEPDTVFTSPAEITAIAWAPDGRLTTGDSKGTILLWNMTTGETETVPPVLDEPAMIKSLVWSPRGYLTYATNDDRNTIIVQDVTGHLEPTLVENRRKVNVIAWSDTAAPVLAAGLDDGNVAIWVVSVVERTSKNIVNYHDHQAGVISLAYAPDGSLASGSKDSTVAVRNGFGTLKAILQGHTDYVNQVAWSDDNQLASASYDKTVILWDLENKVPQRVFRGHSASIFGLDWGPGGKLTSGADFIYVWDTASDSSLTTFTGHLDWTYFVRWTPDGQLVSAGGDGRVIFWNQETQSIAESVQNEYASFDGLDIAANGLLLSGAELIDREAKDTYSIPGTGLGFSPDGAYIVGKSYYGDGNTFDIWSVAPLLASGQLVTNTFTLEGDPSIQVVAWSPDGMTIATGQSDGTVSLWDFNPDGPSATVRATLSGHAGSVNVLAWSADGRLASAGGDQTIIIWNVDTSAQDKVLTSVNGQPITAMSWGPNSELASITGDKNIVVWDVEKGEKKAILGAPYRDNITSLAWSPDGRKLAFGGYSYNVYVYNTLYVQPPCTWLSRNMTFAEWHTYLPDTPYQPTCPDVPVGTAFLDEGDLAAQMGDLATAVERFNQAETKGVPIDAWKWNDLCWYGALYNQAEISSFACDRAVELLPDEGDIRDSRGVSRALLGDFAGAIEDFQAFLDYAENSGYYYSDEEISLREQWIEALQAGTNPFDEATLAMLRGE